MKLLLTGRPGIGKTTVIKKLANLVGEEAGGFITVEVRQGGKRTGFMLECLDGKKSFLAESNPRGKPRIGRYKVLIENLEGIGVEAIRNAMSEEKILLIDEIGKMEILSMKFRELVLDVFNSDLHVIATIGIADDPFLDGIRSIPGVNMIEVTLENRNRLAIDILTMIKEGQSK